MRQQHDERGLLPPLLLAAADKLVDDTLGVVGKVTELGLPEDQGGVAGDDGVAGWGVRLGWVGLVGWLVGCSVIFVGMQGLIPTGQLTGADQKPLKLPSDPTRPRPPGRPYTQPCSPVLEAQHRRLLQRAVPHLHLVLAAGLDRVEEDDALAGWGTLITLGLATCVV
jgi:hypothetical protein